MSFSGLDCPHCNGPLFDGATRCHRCQAPIGKKEMKMALANETLKAYKDASTWSLFWSMLRMRFRLRKAAVKRFFRPAREWIRRRIATV